jgi:hypothetical protein
VHRLEAADLEREVAELAPGHVRRVERDHVHPAREAPRQWPVQVAPEERRPEPEPAGVGPGHGHRLLREVGAVDLGPPDLVGHGEGDRPRPGGQVHGHRPPPPPEPPHGLEREELARVPGDEDPGADADLEPPEQREPLEVRQGLPPRPSGHEPLEPPTGGGRDDPVGLGLLAPQDERQEVLGLDPLPVPLPVVDGPRRLEAADGPFQELGGLHADAS